MGILSMRVRQIRDVAENTLVRASCRFFFGLDREHQSRLYLISRFIVRDLTQKQREKTIESKTKMLLAGTRLRLLYMFLLI